MNLASGLKETIEIGMKFKKRMQERSEQDGKEVLAARVQCPRCEGKLHGRLSGRKRHFRMWCDGDCGTRMME